MMAYAQGEQAFQGTAGHSADRFLRTSLGGWNPVGCLVSVIDDPREAAHAVMALRASGFPPEHVRIIPPNDLLASVGGSGQRGGLIARVVCMLADWSDNTIFAAEYLDEARRGHQVVMVYAPALERADQAHVVVGHHGAHMVRHYGPWVVRGFAG